MSGALGYLSNRPNRMPVSFGTYLHAAKSSLVTGYILLRHTLSAYDDVRTAEQSITRNSPAGAIRPKLLARIERLWEAARTRSDHLEQKSTATLSGLGIAAPIVVALSAFIVKESSISAWIRYTSLVLAVLAIASMVMGFFAILRAISVRKREELGIESIVAAKTFRKSTDDFHGRGLLYVYTKQQALNDHIADFVRAAQMFLAIAVVLVLLAGAVVVPGIATAASRPKQVADPALLQLSGTLKVLIEKTDESKKLRREQFRMQQELDDLRVKVAQLSAKAASNSPALPPANQNAGPVPAAKP